MSITSETVWNDGDSGGGGAIAVVATQNVVRMAFWLVVSLGSVAALFFLLHADFLGAAQLLIYVGGTVVLLVFGVMLTASGLLRAANLAVFELGMWQSWTGR